MGRLRIHHCGVLSQHGSKAGSNDRSVNCSRFCARMAREQWNSGRGLLPRGVYPTPSHIGAPGPPETTCKQGQVARGGWSCNYGLVQGEKTMTTVIRGIVGGPYHPPLWRCDSTDWGYRRCGVVTAAVLTGQLIAIVLCTHGQRAMEQRPRIAAARGVSDTVSHWRTRTARNHMPAGPGCQRGLVFYGPVQGEKAMTTVIRGIVGWP